MFNVGDEVLIRAKIDSVDSESYLPYLIKLGSMGSIWTEEKELLDCKTYADGLNDAWELAKKIVLKAEKGGFNYDDFVRIFGIGDYITLFEKMTVEEALAKIEAYEKEKEIKVGSIVRVKDEKGEAIVTAICPTGVAYVMWKDGSSGDYEFSELETTGRTAEGLDLLLRQIAE